MQLHRELNKYVIGVLSDNSTAGSFVSFIMTVSVADIERIQNKVIWLGIGTTFSRVVLICITSVVANLPEGPPI